MRHLGPSRAIQVVAMRRGGAAPAAAPAAAKPSAPSAPKTGPASAIFAALTKRISDNPGLAGEVRATVKFKVTDPDAEQVCALGGLDPKSPDATFTLSDDTLVSLAKGQATARDLFQRGKLRIDGDLAV